VSALRVLGDDERTDWLAWRRGGLGGSDIAAVAGLSPFATPTTVYLEKIGLLQDQAKEEDWQRMGRLLEPVIAALFEEETGHMVASIRPQECVTHAERPWQRATLDGVVLDEDDPPEPVEIKSTTRWASDWGDEPPDYYQCQLQWQMDILGSRRGWMAALVDGRRFRWWEVPRRQGEIDLLVSLGAAFWKRVLERRPPPVDGSEATNEGVKAAYRDREREAIDLNAADLELVHDLREARAARLAAEKTERRAQSAVLALLEGAEEGRWQNEPVVRWSRLQRTTDDMDALRVACAANDMEIPKKTTPYRQLWLPKESA
jgi:putative phage-type endonuclease